MRHRIIGFHHDILGPIINCGLEIPSLNITGVVFPFLLDTGSSITTLSNYYADQLSIDYSNANNLRKDKPVSGIGGTVDAYLVENAALILFSDENNAIRFTFNNWAFRITKLEHPDPTIRQRLINTIPNIIGRDVFLQPNFQFTYKANGVLLEVDT